MCSVKQLRDREEKLQELAETAQEPLARYEGDEKLEAHLKEQMLKEDPMLRYISKKKEKKDRKPGK